MGNVFNMSEEEKKKILEKHKDATKNHYQKKEDLKNGLKKPEKKEDMHKENQISITIKPPKKTGVDTPSKQNKTILIFGKNMYRSFGKAMKPKTPAKQEIHTTLK